MISGGTATVFVTDFERALAFYSVILELTVLERFGNDWASLQAGTGLVLSLHPVSEKSPLAGKQGSLSIGFTVESALDEVVQTLTTRGVQFQGPIQGDNQSAIRLAFFEDPDGNALYLCETKRLDQPANKKPVAVKKPRAALVKNAVVSPQTAMV